MKQFLKQHAPYRKRYLYQYESETLYGTETSWASRSSFLSENIIEAAILGRAVYAYLASTHTRTLGIDIDDHKNLGEEYLISLYDQTVNKIGLMPSLLVKSPRGLHAYWYIEQFLPTEILVTIAERNMRGIPIEIKPTMTTALRIPNQNTLIDPKTLKKLGKSLEDAIAQAEVYHYAELFEGKLHSHIPADRKQRKDRVVSLRKAEALYQIEAKVVPIGFLDGCTNQQFLELEQAYRCAGLSIEAALDRFKLILDRSYGYTSSKADAINLKSIERRLKCTYKKNDAPIVYKPIEVSLFNQPIIDSLIARSPFAKQREQPLRRFLSKLLTWTDWHDDIMKDKAQIAVFDYYYRYYRKNRKEGYYPLPYSLLSKWNGHYTTILNWLLEIGFLEASPYQYSKQLSICKYYKVNTERFSI